MRCCSVSVSGSQELELAFSNPADVIKVGIGISAPAKRLLPSFCWKCRAANPLQELCKGYARPVRHLQQKQGISSLLKVWQPFKNRPLNSTSWCSKSWRAALQDDLTHACAVLVPATSAGTQPQSQSEDAAAAKACGVHCVMYGSYIHTYACSKS